MKTSILRGDMFYAELPQGVGSEQSGSRPVIVLQNDIGNKHSTTIIVAPLTSDTHAKTKLPTHYPLKVENGLVRPSIVLLEQILTIDKRRLTSYVGKVSEKSLLGIDFALAISVGFIDPVSKTKEFGLCDTCKDMLSKAGAFSFTNKDVGCTCARCGWKNATLYCVTQKR